MFQSDDKFDIDPAQNTNSEKDLSDRDLENIDANVSSENVAARKNKIERVFIKLIVVGLAVGAILGVGIYYLMNKFGLNKRPYQIEQERIERQQSGFDETKVFPSLPKSLKG